MPDTCPPGVVNTSFSTLLPTLQTTIDSTSLGEFKTCPRKYFYRLIEGWVPRSQSVHLTFGLLLHQGREAYERARATSQDHEAGLRTAVRYALTATWDKATERPWWSGHSVKNRLTLLRTLVWYLDQFGQEDSLETIQLANGQPAIELSFKMDSGFRSHTTGEGFTFCGHIDRLARLGAETYVCDLKTTGSSLGLSFFAQYSPDNQFSLYTLAGRVAFHTPVAGVIVDAAQIGASFSRFERQPVLRTEDQVNEWLRETGFWLAVLEQSAAENQWPMNDKACHHYGGCPYRPVCCRPPSARQKWLETDYTRQIWDPAIVREP